MVTLDAASTRFHACERLNKCSHIVGEYDKARDREESPEFGYAPEAIVGDKSLIVYVNPLELSKMTMKLYATEMTDRLDAAKRSGKREDWPSLLVS